MEISFSTAPIENDGRILTHVALEEMAHGDLPQDVVVRVWVMADDSRGLLTERTRLAAIAYLERALAALRAG